MRKNNGKDDGFRNRRNYFTPKNKNNIHMQSRTRSEKSIWPSLLSSSVCLFHCLSHLLKNSPAIFCPRLDLTMGHFRPSKGCIQKKSLCELTNDIAIIFAAGIVRSEPRKIEESCETDLKLASLKQRGLIHCLTFCFVM